MTADIDMTAMTIRCCPNPDLRSEPNWPDGTEHCTRCLTTVRYTPDGPVLDRTTSPLGDRRERPVRCDHCGRFHVNIRLRCDRCWDR